MTRLEEVKAIVKTARNANRVLADVAQLKLNQWITDRVNGCWPNIRDLTTGAECTAARLESFLDDLDDLEFSIVLEHAPIWLAEQDDKPVPVPVPPAAPPAAPAPAATPAAPAAPAASGNPIADAMMATLLPAIRDIVQSEVKAAPAPELDRNEVQDIVTNAMIAMRDDVHETIKQMASDAIAAAPASARSAVIKAMGGVASGDPIVDALQRFASPSAATVPILLKGPAGAGKTHNPEVFAQTAGFSHPMGIIRLDCQPGMESIDFVGKVDAGAIGTGKGEAFCYGPLGEAFAYVGTDDPCNVATCENTVLLLIDEINRLDLREQAIFLTALNPKNINGVRCYTLRTGRTVTKGGVATEEVLYAPTHLLSIVATGNVGLDYPLPEADPAETARWIELQVTCQQDVVASIVEKECESRGYREDLATGLVDLWQCTVNMRRDGLLRFEASTRHLVRIIEITPSDSFDDVNATAQAVLQQLCDWTAEGSRNPDQLESLNQLITDKL